jgi:hypothetical protein
MDVIDQYTLAFFNQTLKGQPEPLLTEMSREFPEARLEVWTSPTPAGLKYSQNSSAVPATAAEPASQLQR